MPTKSKAPPAIPELYALLLEMSGEAVLLHAGDRIELANEAAALLLGAGSAADLVGRKASELLPPAAGAQRGAKKPDAYPKRRSIATRVHRLDGTGVEVQLSQRECRWAGAPACQVVIRSSAPGLAAPADPANASADVLTELPNRRQFRAYLQPAIDRAVRNRHQLWILYVDLDRFSSVNALHGHAVGDRVLQEAAVRLHRCVRKTDFVASPGGDEFLIALEGTADEAGARVVAGRALASLALPFEIDGVKIALSACIGITHAPGDGASPDVLLQNVDVAMWQAKAGSANRMELYSEAMDAQRRHSSRVRAEVEQRFASLTPKESEVLDHLVAGEANKMIAYQLGSSMRTIEHHRARIMSKMQAGSLPELVRMVIGRREG
jgi:diguanylate cyclase (GGDEF)-like protein